MTSQGLINSEVVSDFVNRTVAGFAHSTKLFQFKPDAELPNYAVLSRYLMLEDVLAENQPPVTDLSDESQWEIALYCCTLAIVLARYTSSNDVLMGFNYNGCTLPLRISFPEDEAVAGLLTKLQRLITDHMNFMDTYKNEINTYNERNLTLQLCDCVYRADVEDGQTNGFLLQAGSDSMSKHCLKINYLQDELSEPFIDCFLGHFADVCRQLAMGNATRIAEIELLSPADLAMNQHASQLAPFIREREPDRNTSLQLEQSTVMFVITIVTRALEQRAPVRMDDSLKELGMNSLKFIRIIIDIETEYDLTVAPEDAVLHNFQTPSDFVQYILARV
ncbi:hypothetical protein K0T92_04700 [Paenibacillus oenotherae]|uniref:Carrier domain-containing protein n=1 Tax=Paenibacillus oenotherae TaxID=1435645 RepID=A0ABS7D262_9BACL|nr:hypothetical protein [Paenibacillus oenotherae]